MIHPLKTPLLSHEFTHFKELKELRAIAEAAWREYEIRFEKYIPTMSWLDETRAAISFTVLGICLRGEIVLLPETIRIALEVPLALRIFRKRAIVAVENEIKKWL